MPSDVIRSCSRARSAGVGSASGERPAIALDLQPVPVEVAERVVRDDDRVPRAVLQPLCVVASPSSSRSATRSARWPVRRPRGRGRCSASSSATASVRVAIRAGSCQKCGSSSPASSVESSRSTTSAASSTSPVGDLVDGVVDGGLEAVLEQHQVGVLDLGGLLDRRARGRAARCPGGVRLVTSTWSPPTRSATNASG